jgi:hypothetical protein
MLAGKLKMPICSKCKIDKSESEFYRRGGDDKLRRECGECTRKKNLHSWHKKTPEQKRDKQLRFKYGINTEKFNRFLAQQSGGCCICGKEIDRKGGVDHDHNTGKIRGILCSHCNAAIGHMNDDVSLLRRAITYIENGGFCHGS